MEGERRSGKAKVAKGENGSEGIVMVNYDLVTASRFESTVTRKRADRVRRKNMTSSSPSVAGGGGSLPSTLCVGSGQHVAQGSGSVAAVGVPTMPPVFRLTPVYDIDRTKLRFLFQKILQNSDVNYLKRIIIPKKAAEEHLPTFQNRVMQLTVYDVDGHHKWTFKYRYWPNNSSRMYVFENAGDFVAAHALQAGDSFMMYIDSETENFVIEAKKSEALSADPIVKQYLEAAPEIAVPPSDIFPNFPLDDNVSKLYDTSSFCNESPLDFLGGSASSHQYPYSSQSDFIDNISFDDFHF